jgi:hypothetical protein
MDQGLKFNLIAAIDLQRDVVKQGPGWRKILRVEKRSALLKARSVPLFDAQRNSCRTSRHRFILGSST